MTLIQDLTVRQGSRYQAVIDVRVEWLADLTGYDARGTVRRSQTLEGPVLADLTPYLTVDEANHTVTIDLPANISAAWEWRQGHYDLEVFDTNPAHDVRFMQGEITLDWEVTH